MVDFQFLQNPVTKKWVVLAPRRSKRTNVGEVKSTVCPFCPGQEANEQEVYRQGGQDSDSNWTIRVVPNKFPFTPHHEVVIHSPDHHKNFDELPLEQVELVFKTYRQRFNVHKNNGQVYIFHNSGHAGGESIPHPHTQITVVPNKVYLDIPKLDESIYKRNLRNIFDFKSKKEGKFELLETDSFVVFCPPTSEWPDEVWVAPKQNGNYFGSISDHQIRDFSFVVARIIQIFDLRHGFEFPYNFYISSSKNWYFRLIPRIKILGGFELGTQVIVNTQDASETFAFIKEHFWEPNKDKIKKEHQAEYLKSV